MTAAAQETTIQEIAAALDAFEQILPEADAAAAIFAPGVAAALAPFIPIFSAAVRGVDTVAKDTGKPFPDVLTDVLNHLTPGAPNAPALS